MAIFNSNLRSNSSLISIFFLLPLFLAYIPISLAIRPNYLYGSFSLHPKNTTIFTHMNAAANGHGMVRTGNGLRKDRVVGQHPIKPSVFTNKNGPANGVDMFNRFTPGNRFGKGRFIGKQKQHRSMQSIKPTIFTNNGGEHDGGMVNIFRTGNGLGREIGIVGKEHHADPSIVIDSDYTAEPGLNRFFGSGSKNKKERRTGTVVDDGNLNKHVQPISRNDGGLNKLSGAGSSFRERRGKRSFGGERYRGKAEQQQSEGLSMRRKFGEARPSVSPPAGVGK